MSYHSLEIWKFLVEHMKLSTFTFRLDDVVDKIGLMDMKSSNLFPFFEWLRDSDAWSEEDLKSLCYDMVVYDFAWAPSVGDSAITLRIQNWLENKIENPNRFDGLSVSSKLKLRRIVELHGQLPICHMIRFLPSFANWNKDTYRELEILYNAKYFHSA